MHVHKQGEELHEPRETWLVSTELKNQRAIVDGPLFKRNLTSFIQESFSTTPTYAKVNDHKDF